MFKLLIIEPDRPLTFCTSTSQSSNLKHLSALLNSQSASVENNEALLELSKKKKKIAWLALRLQPPPKTDAVLSNGATIDLGAVSEPFVTSQRASFQSTLPETWCKSMLGISDEVESA